MWEATATQTMVRLGDTVFLGGVFYNPSGYVGIGGTPNGKVPFVCPVNSDVTPVFFAVRNASDTTVQTGNFTLRTGYSGAYRASFAASAANGFSTGDYVEVFASGKYNGVMDVGLIKAFQIDTPFSANITQISGEPIGTTTYVADQVWQSLEANYTGVGAPAGQNLTFGSGCQTSLGAVSNANIVQVGGSGINLVGVVPANLIQIGGSGVNLAGVVPANVQQISGEPVAQSTYVADQVWNAPTTYTANNTMGSGLNQLTQAFYYANIKSVVGDNNQNDVYSATWYKNNAVLPSSLLANPALTVTRVDTNTNIITNGVMTFTNAVNANVFFTSTASTLFVSGVPYMIVTSGLIDGVSRVWSQLTGVDIL